MQSDTLAIDFGTSNSAAATLVGGNIHRIAIEHSEQTLPTAVFFPAGRGAMRIGAAAAQALIDGEDGRYMRALKSVLGTQLLHERRLIGGRDRTLAGIITEFLIELRERSQASTGQSFRRALSGRPVHFHSANAEKDKQAEKDLHACYLAAGFEEVTFLAEPEAAALVSHSMGLQGSAGSADSANQIGLIVDIGGGTSDFSVFRSHGSELEILANHGIRLGGTDFDYAVSMAHAMPSLGLGGELHREMGKGLLPVPRAPFVDLATWAKIPFLYTTKTRGMVSDMARMAVDRQKMDRFATVLELELGHELAFTIERGKIAVNQGGKAENIDMGFIEKGMSQTVTPQSLNVVLSDSQVKLGKAASKSLEMAGVAADDIGRVILVGGSSLMSFVTDEMRALCPGAEILRSQAFTAVVDGLALAIRRRSQS